MNRQHTAPDQGLLKDLGDVLQCPVCHDAFTQPPIREPAWDVHVLEMQNICDESKRGSGSHLLPSLPGEADRQEKTVSRKNLGKKVFLSCAAMLNDLGHKK